MENLRDQVPTPDINLSTITMPKETEIHAVIISCKYTLFMAHNFYLTINKRNRITHYEILFIF